MKKHIIVRILVLGLIGVPITLIPGISHVDAQEAQEVKKELIPLDLDATEWNVTMIYTTEKGKTETTEDRLVFSKNQFISKGFEDKGYVPTNYSAVAELDGSTKFGTMQIKGKDTSFWKGVVVGDTIDGSVHTQFANGKNSTTYFNGKLVSGVLVEKGQKKPEPIPEPPVENTEGTAVQGDQAGEAQSEEPSANMPSEAGSDVQAIENK